MNYSSFTFFSFFFMRFGFLNANGFTAGNVCEKERGTERREEGVMGNRWLRDAILFYVFVCISSIIVLTSAQTETCVRDAALMRALRAASATILM